MKHDIRQYLDEHGGRLADSHFVFTSGKHSTEYFNIRAVAHHADWMRSIGQRLANAVDSYGPDILVGPETLGRTFVDYTAPFLGGVMAIWCDIVGEGEAREATFSPKLDFGRLVAGKRVAIIDDLLTSGSSIKLVSDLITEYGGTAIVAAAVVRRFAPIEAMDCGVPALEVLEDIEGALPYTPEDCEAHGPCSRQVPMVLRPGHGHDWIKTHENYPVAS